MAQVVFGQVIQAKYFDYTEVLVAVLLLFLCSQGLVTGLCLCEQVSFGKEFNFLFFLLQELVHIYKVLGWSWESISSHV